MPQPSSSNEVVNVNFDNLIQTTNEVTSDFKNELLVEMNNQFDNEEQRIFVNSFYAYLNNHQTEDFVIDLDILYKFIGFSRKDPLKRLLEKNFSEGTDYKNLLHPEVEQVKVNGGAGLNKETIMLNVDTFKNICMIANTQQAKVIRTYYIKLENVVMKVINKSKQFAVDNLTIKTKMIAKNDYIVDQFDKKSVAYLGLVEENKDFSIIKYGHTSNIKRRTSAHKQTYGDQYIVSFALESIAHYEIERQIQNHNDLQSRKIKTYNGKEFNELLRIDKNFTMDNLIDIMKLISLNISKNISLELEKEKTKQIQEKTKQETEKTKQMELQLKMMEIENKNKPSTSVSTQIQTNQEEQETSREEITQVPEIVQESIQSKTKRYNENKNIINGRLVYIKQGIDKKIPEVIDKFLEEKTQVSENKRDSILVSELFKKFKDWYSDYIVGYTMFITFVKKSQLLTIKPNPTGKKATKIIYRKFVS
jgi:phage anti-repressor protein